MFKAAYLRLLFVGLGILLSRMSLAQTNSDTLAPLLKKTEQWLISRKDSLSPSSLLILHQLYTQTGYRIQGLDPCALLKQRQADGLIHARAAMEGCMLSAPLLKGKQPKTSFDKLAAGIYLYPSAYRQEELLRSIWPLINSQEAPWADLMYLMRYAVKKEIVHEFSYGYDSLLASISNKVVKVIENPRNSLQKRLEIYAAAIQTGVLNHVHWRWIKNLIQWQQANGTFSSGGNSQQISESLNISAFVVLQYATFEKSLKADRPDKRKP
jgi:hypothetical protein